MACKLYFLLQVLIKLAGSAVYLVQCHYSRYLVAFLPFLMLRCQEIMEGKLDIIFLHHGLQLDGNYTTLK